MLNYQRVTGGPHIACLAAARYHSHHLEADDVDALPAAIRAAEVPVETLVFMGAMVM